jgi:hypothetical protein
MLRRKARPALAGSVIQIKTNAIDWRKNAQRQAGSHSMVTPMKKPVLSIDEPEPKKAPRADRPPTDGFVVVVDGHFKSEFDAVDAAEASGRKLKSAYPMLQIEIYDAATKVRTLLS